MDYKEAEEIIQRSVPDHIGVKVRVPETDIQMTLYIELSYYSKPWYLRRVLPFHKFISEEQLTNIAKMYSEELIKKMELLK